MNSNSTVISAAQNKAYLKKFKDADALGQAKAVTLEELGLKNDMVIKHLMRLRALSARAGKYYITVQFSRSSRFDEI